MTAAVGANSAMDVAEYKVEITTNLGAQTVYVTAAGNVATAGIRVLNTDLVVESIKVTAVSKLAIESIAYDAAKVQLVVTFNHEISKNDGTAVAATGAVTGTKVQGYTVSGKTITIDLSGAPANADKITLAATSIYNKDQGATTKTDVLAGDITVAATETGSDGAITGVTDLWYTFA